MLESETDARRHSLARAVNDLRRADRGPPTPRAVIWLQQKSPISASCAGPRMLDRVSSTPQRVRTLFLSDIHLGTRGCQADKLLDLLRHYEADTIYLVGDIVDGWRLKSAWYWPQLHNDVVQKLLRQARKGVRLFYIPGNHDEFLRDYYGAARNPRGRRQEWSIRVRTSPSPRLS